LDLFRFIPPLFGPYVDALIASLSTSASDVLNVTYYLLSFPSMQSIFRRNAQKSLEFIAAVKSSGSVSDLTQFLSAMKLSLGKEMVAM
jgi:hypothetical protein